MPPIPRALSNDLKAQIPHLSESRHSVSSICKLLNIKKTLVYKTLKWYKLCSLPYSPYAGKRTGRPSILSNDDVDFVDKILEADGTLYLDNIQSQLLAERQVAVSIPTIHCTLVNLYITRKRVSRQACEWNEILRAAFMNRMAEVVTCWEMLLCINESAKDERTVGRQFGYARLGQECPVQQTFVRGTRYSILSILSVDGYVAAGVYKGSVDRKAFLQFLREEVVSPVFSL